MHKILILAATVLSLAACTTTQQGAAVGAGAGAIVGAATTGTVLGTAVGAGVGGVVGAAAGSMVGRVDGSNNICVYQRADGSRYRDTCPRG
ncbi:glycine zipper domain-containing protein [Devosia aquimaris]|uniref:glycine zipper domain-containing protein n=1 Tax=Devosia aquimaris TaxID=2866214 RepID=UPI001CD0B0CF|nr:glycine zipper domain-containing protein [Devosia sp. CJK-A8-3]